MQTRNLKSDLENPSDYRLVATENASQRFLRVIRGARLDLVRTIYNCIFIFGAPQGKI
jgi:hypothetical protein